MSGDFFLERAKKIALKNQSITLCYHTREQLEKLGTKISVEEKEKIYDLIIKLKDATKHDNYVVIKKLNEKLKNAVAFRVWLSKRKN